MKKSFVLLVSFLIFSISCQKEMVDSQEEQNNIQEEVIPAGIPKYINASIDDVLSKTTYNGSGKYEWESDDQIAVIYTYTDSNNKLHQGWLAYEVDNLSNSNKTASFKLVSGQTTKTAYYTDESHVYTATGQAVFPVSVARPFSGTNEVTTYSNGTDTVPFITMGSSGSSNLTDIVLTGLLQSDESYKFSTSGSVLKVTVNNVPAATRSIVLQTGDKYNYPLTGDFFLNVNEGAMLCTFGTEGTYGTSFYTYFSDKLTAPVIPESEGASVTVFFNVPVGSYNKKNILSLHLLDSDGVCLDTKYIGAKLTTRKNELLSLPELTLDTWTTLGTGAFIDKFHSENWKHTEVEIQQSTGNSNKYRLVNPYKQYAEANNYTRTGINPDTYLYFEISGTNVVFSPCNSGIYHPSYKNYGQTLVLSFNNWSGASNTNPEYSKVVKTESGQPAIIQIAPYYAFANMSNGFPRQNYNDRIKIIFPGYYDHSVSVTGNATQSDPVLGVSGNKVAYFKYNIQGTEKEAREKAFTEYIAASSTSTLSIPVLTTATNYLGVKYYDSDKNELYFTTYPIYHLSTDDATSFAKQYSFTPTDGTNFWHPGTSSSYATTMTLAVSDNVTKGNLMISELYGKPGANKKLYGVLTSSSATSITFAYNGDSYGQQFFYQNSNNFHIAQGTTHDATASSDNIVFNVTNGPVLTCENYLMMKFTSNYTSWNEFISGVGLVFN